jgi:hypothetical protein
VDKGAQQTRGEKLSLSVGPTTKAQVVQHLTISNLK